MSDRGNMSESDVKIVLHAIDGIRDEVAGIRNLLSEKYVTQEVHQLCVERVKKLELVNAWVVGIVMTAVMGALLALVIVKP